MADQGGGGSGEEDNATTYGTAPEDNGQEVRGGGGERNREDGEEEGEINDNQTYRTARKSEPRRSTNHIRHSRNGFDDEGYDIFDPTRSVFKTRREVFRRKDDSRKKDIVGDRKENDEERSREKPINDQRGSEEQSFLHTCKQIWEKDGDRIKNNMDRCNSDLMNAARGEKLDHNYMVRITAKEKGVKHFLIDMLKNFLKQIGEEETYFGAFLYAHFSIHLLERDVTEDEILAYVQDIQKDLDRARTPLTEAKTRAMLQKLYNVNQKQELVNGVTNKTSCKHSISGYKNAGNGNNTESSNESLHIAARRNLERMGYKTWEA